jgi:hypothetical protein
MSDPQIVPPFRNEWRYIEFLPPGDAATKMDGINEALTWLNANIQPPAGTVVGNTDGKGDVRFFYYGPVIPLAHP